jgi:hypothetical protein
VEIGYSLGKLSTIQALLPAVVCVYAKYRPSGDGLALSYHFGALCRKCASPVAVM